MGPTGAGKTTIINMIARFYDSVEGDILLDGQDIKKATFSSLRKAVSVMPQDSVLFTGTIRDNLTYGKDVDDAIIDEKIKELNLTSLIDSLPSGYDTLIKDAGLSSGQKQLIALARTMIADPKILILDEATSALDADTERKVLENIKSMTDKTVIIVTHRPAALSVCDRQIVFDAE